MALVQVRATRVGYYAHKKRREGEIFEVDEKDLSLSREVVGEKRSHRIEGWMEVLGKQVVPESYEVAAKEEEVIPEEDSGEEVI